MRTTARAYTGRAFRARLGEEGIRHRRGGYRDPEPQAFIESWFSKLKLRCVWREQFGSINEAREKITAYIDRDHHRPTAGSTTAPPRSRSRMATSRQPNKHRGMKRQPRRVQATPHTASRKIRASPAPASRTFGSDLIQTLVHLANPCLPLLSLSYSREGKHRCHLEDPWHVACQAWLPPS